MSYIYLIRHAQAGTRENYDHLSDLGQRQARLLGESFAEQGIEFDTLYSGSMRRQQLTAQIACEAMKDRGIKPPEPVVDERWNEFSLISVYRAIMHRLVEDSEEFARDYREMTEALRRDPHTTGGATGRCDIAVIRAWMEDRYPDYDGEKWSVFKSRIQECASCLPQYDAREKAIAIFTSATPIAITAGTSLGLSDDALLSILGVIQNTSVTVMRVRDDALRLFTFNATQHLNPRMRTFR
ncbi:MAG TPA: histidine phosphatase family protein [Blastocatellia bacterium]|jgi:broad specificity phosphatase PhoE